MLRTVLLAVFAGLLLWIADAARANDADPLFQEESLLEVEIEGPFKLLARERPDDEEFPGTFRYTAQDGELVELDVVLRTRGRLRRDKDTCTFPPLRLNFKKSDVDGTLFDKQDKLKLVSHCRNNARRYTQAVVAEYLSYRIFNLLTDKSFHARLLHATYVYTDDKKTIDNYAILIEHKDRLEKRLDAKVTEVDMVKVSEIEPEDLNLTSVFQYFIGNTDFSPIATAPDEDCCHNQVLLKPEGDQYLTMPYDFDQSGLVDAPYAEPNPRFRLRSSRDRLYRGRCVNNEYLPATLDLFRERRSAIEQLIRGQAELDAQTTESMLDFIEEFYETIDNPRQLEREITSKCL